MVVGEVFDLMASQGCFLFFTFCLFKKEEMLLAIIVIFVLIGICLYMMYIRESCMCGESNDSEFVILSETESVDEIQQTKTEQRHFSMKCINLPTSVNRRAFITRQVQSSDFIDSWSFEEGIDGHKLPSLLEGDYQLLDGSSWPYVITLSDANVPHDPGVIGCTLSHLKAITSMQSIYCLIIEDDAFLSMCHLHDHFDMDRIIKEAPLDWGIIQLGCNQRSTLDFRPWVSADRMYGAYAYLVKQECADSIRQLLVRPDGTMHLDQALSKEKYIYADFFLYGLVNEATTYKTYTYTIFSTYNNKTTLDSTLHVENTDRHIHATGELISELIQNRLSVKLDIPKQSRVVDASLCIPCHYEHLNNLRILLLSLFLQEYMTSEIVISISSIPPNMDAIQLKTLLQPLVPDSILVIHAFHEVQYAGTNRNVCIENSKYDILIFMDADDLMYSNRIRVAYEKMVARPLLTSLLHSYTRPDTARRDANYAEMMGREIYDLHLDWVGSTSIVRIPTNIGSQNGFGLKSNGFGIHNGHPILRRSTLIQNGLRYTDDKRGQDAIFNRTILQKLGRSDDTMMFINTPLTYYIQENSSLNFT
jgi:hypothetical protein